MAKKLFATPRRPSKNVLASAVDMSRREARFLVEDYFRWKKLYMAHLNHLNLLKKEYLPTDCTNFLNKSAKKFRIYYSEFLGLWAQNFPAAHWAMKLNGISGFTAGALAAFIDVEKTKNVASVWKYAGQTPNSRPPTVKRIYWAASEAERQLGGPTATEDHVRFIAKRLALDPENVLLFCKKHGEITWKNLIGACKHPTYNPTLKQVCTAIGHLFIIKESFYQDLYRYRFHWEKERSEAGRYAKKAQQQLDTWFNYKPETLAYKAYIQGKLPDFHLRNRAKKWAVKVFLAHYYTIDYYTRYGKLPPDTYGLDILKGTKKIHVPDWDKDKIR